MAYIDFSVSYLRSKFEVAGKQGSNPWSDPDSLMAELQVLICIGPYKEVY
jgi:hypothetical protein